MKYFSYKPILYPFRQAVAQAIGGPAASSQLEFLHTWDLSTESLKTARMDQNTPYHKSVYDNFYYGDDVLKIIYNRFIEEQIRPIFDYEPIVVQKVPGFRVQLPNGVAVQDPHRDRDFHHHTKEINFYLPLTDAYNTATIWAESEDGKGDYSPIEGMNGDFFMWDGASCRHFNKPNDEGYTRVSFDFRVIRLVDFDKGFYDKAVSVAAGVKFQLGSYWCLVV
jgi:hypothetical protein